MVTPSPLRYPGGKTKLYPYISRVMDANPMNNTTYVEPYAGGCGLALTLLFQNRVNNIIINDYDYAIYAFWYCVLNRTAELCERILETPVTIEQWDIQKNIYLNSRDYDILDAGFATFFLNRTNRSGIINGGIIGGRDQLNKYKIDCRFTKDPLITKILNIAAHRDRITLYNLDAVELIETVINQLPEDDVFIYFDPPYVKKGPELYVNHYNFQDHQELSFYITNHVRQSWFITYDFTKEISDLYQNFKQDIIDIHYSAGKSKRGTELAIFSERLDLPNELEDDIVNG